MTQKNEHYQTSIFDIIGDDYANELTVTDYQILTRINDAH